MGFELKISAGERPQTYALDRAPTGTGGRIVYQQILTDVKLKTGKTGQKKAADSEQSINP